MKMRDVFELPVDYVDFIEMDSARHPDRSECAAHAINMHDELVDGLDCVLTCWLEDCDPTELALVVNRAMSILTRAKGAE